MALKINNKAGIRATFAAHPHLTEVHVLPTGAHYFTLDHAEQALQEGEEITTLQADSDELKAKGKAAPEV